MKLLAETYEFIIEEAHKAKKPAAMLSFGKDSMVMASLIRNALSGIHGLNGQHFPLTHGFPLPVIYHRDPWFAHKHDFADRQIRAWGMETYDFHPLCAGVKTNEKLIELISRYQLGSAGLDLSKNVLQPEDYPRRDYICGLRDWIARPLSVFSQYPWDMIFLGHKSSDVDLFEGHVPLKTPTAEIGGVRLAFPLKEWTDENVWDYIEVNHVPLDERRYQGRKEVADRWYNNDYMHACTRCIDPREMRKVVPCPKLKRDVPNVGHFILQLHAKPTYIDKEEEHATRTTS